MKLLGEEIFFIDCEYDDRFLCLYVPLRSYLALVHRELRDEVTKPESAITIALIKHLQQLPLIDIKKIHELIVKSPPELVLELTDDCNLSCRYCHASAGESGKQAKMSYGMIDGIVEEFFHNNSSSTNKDVVITFSGGEPTYVFPQLKYAVQRSLEISRKKGVNCSFRMATNGCFSSKICDFIIEHFSDISLSFDGPPHIQNKHRPLANGSPSFELVYRTACLLYKSGFSFGFRVTVSDYSLPYLEEIVDFFNEHFPGKQIGFEPLNPFGRGALDNELNPPNRQHFALALLDVIRRSEEKTIRIENAGVGKFEGLRTIFCKAVALPSWNVGTTGTLSACSRDNAPDVFVFGNYDAKLRKFTINHERLARLHRLNVFNIPECSDCFCKYHCAGDCPDLRLSGIQECRVNQLLGSYYLNKKLRES